MYTVLIVDDEPMMRKSLQMLLQDTDMSISDILLARDGEEALKVCEESTPDLIVTDVRMPKMDGLELCSIACEKYKNTSLVIISGYDDFKYAQKALKYGVKEYLLKPVNREDFIDCAARCVKKIKELEASILDSSYKELKKSIGEDFGNTDNMEYIMETALDKFSGLTVNYCRILTVKLINHIIATVCERTGERFEFKFSGYEGNSKSEFFSWFKAVMKDLRSRVNELQINNKYFAIKIAKDYIEKNYSQEFSLDDISGELGFNSSYFSQLFKAKTGQTFVQYKNQVRLEKARELLEKTKKSVTQVAMEVGYNDISHFIKIYKKATGDTPNEYREKRGMI